MTGTLLVLAVIMAAPSDDLAANGVAQPTRPRPYHQISRELSALLKEESKAASDVEQAEVVGRMSTLYREIALDPRLANSETLQEYKGRLWSRLRRIKNEVKDQPRQAKADRRKSPNDSKVLAKTPEELQVASKESLSTGTQSGSSSKSSTLKAQFSSPKPPANGGGAVADNGAALVDLIERTISPEFWNVNGGPGAIYYWWPKQALVVRATGEVHHELGGTLDALRAAGQ